MYTKNKLFIFCLIILVFFSISAVVAGDVDDSLKTGDTHDILTSDAKTFSQLDKAINSNNCSEVSLNHDYGYNRGSDSDGINITRPVTVEGNGNTISGNYKRIFNVLADNVTFKNIIFTKAYSNGTGSAINGKCTIINCTFINNEADFGGAVYLGNAINCTFKNNHANHDGGAIYLGNAINCTFIDNHAEYGGAVYGYSSDCQNCDFTGNSAMYGGAIYGSSAENCSFTQNSALERGGAICGELSSCINCIFRQNTASGIFGGGAIYGSGSSCINCIFIENKAKESSGGAVNDDNASCINCSFSNNSARYGGGAMYGGLAVNSSFSYNHADSGGAIEFGSASNCIFISNSASWGGGAMRGGNDVADDCIFISNYASFKGGGAIYSVVAGNCRFINNTARNNGGASYEGAVFNSKFENNCAKEGGAAYDSYIVNCLFEYNSATNGGAVGKGIAINSTFNFNNATNLGGAIYCGNVSAGSRFKGNIKNDTYNVTFFEYDNVKTINELRLLIMSCKESDIYLDSDYVYTVYDDCLEIQYGVKINRNITIHGNGHSIDMKRHSRIFHISTDSSPVFTNLVLINGYEEYPNGGAIRGFCKAINCTFINNSVAYYGGALYLGVAINCTFINNSAHYGGAISNGYSINCTFINNSANHGGALYETSTLNSCFYNNSAHIGGAIYSSNNIAINSTFANNCADYGGALYQTNVKNCNFTNNSAGVSGGAMYGGISIYSNFIMNHAGSNGGAMAYSHANSCLFENNTAVNGGAISRSEAVDCTFNYNNATGLGGAVYCGNVSLGSKFKGNIKNDTYNATFMESVSGTPFIELYELIRTGDSDIYMEDDYTFDLIHDLELREGIRIDRPVTIHGNGHTINACKVARMFFVSDDNVVFKDIIFINGDSIDYAGAVYGKCRLINCTFINNAASYIGGALYMGTAINCTFINNTAGEGGALHRGAAINSTFINNTAKDGGALYNCNAVNCNFTNNKAISRYAVGGAMDNGNATDCTFRDNYANSSGGATFSVILNSCILINNNALEFGGAADYGRAYDCIFINNTALNGGAINCGDAYNSVFINNSASNGGALNDRCFAKNCSFTSNTASENGGAISDCYAEDCIFTDNAASELGGAAYQGGLNRCIFKSNRANVSGDNYYNSSIVYLILKARNFTSTYNSGEKLTFDLKTEDKKSVDGVNITILTYDGDELTGVYYALNDEGWVADLYPGQYRAVLKVENQAYYFDSAEISVDIDSPIKISSKTVACTYNRNRYLTVTLKDSNGKPRAGVKVTINFNGIKTAKTNKDGEINISIKNLVPKSYTAKIVFTSGNDKSFINLKVVVKKANPKIAAKAKAFKKSDRIKKFTITLKDNKKAMKKAKVTLKVNGKTYKVKTDKKGKATFLIVNLNKKGKFKAFIKFAGNKYYNKASKKVKLMVR